MCLHLYQPELGLAGWLTGYTKDLFHRVTASHKPYSGEQHLLHNKVVPSFQCADNSPSQTDGPKLAQKYEVFHSRTV